MVARFEFFMAVHELFLGSCSDELDLSGSSSFVVLSISTKFPKNTIFLEFFVWFTRDGEIEGLR